MTSAQPAPDIPQWRAMGATPRPASPPPIADVVIIGAGPVGLTLALDLGRRGRRVVVLSKLDFIAGGSKAICFAKRTLDIWGRLGVGADLADQGVAWNIGKVFWGADPAPIYQFDLAPVKQQRMPAFVNLQQYHVEARLVRALEALPNVEIRWGHELTAIRGTGDTVLCQVRAGARETYDQVGRFAVACDGSRSPTRQFLGLDFDGRVFEDNFLIADIRLPEHSEQPLERWFWFDPPFNPGRSALLHRQPDNIWRLDFQLGWDIDRKACARPDAVEPYVRGLLGPHVAFEPEWYSVYTFQCRRMQSFVHGRVLFAGDSAHLVSPFGARGCNGGVADADNLGWKLDLVLEGAAPHSLLATYDLEAIITADENILHSTRSTEFLTPKSAWSRALRDAVLSLAKEHAFARPLVNSGRLSSAVVYGDTPLSTPDAPDAVWAGVAPGSPALDGPLGDGWLLDALGSGRFTLLTNDRTLSAPAGLALVVLDEDNDPTGALRARYDLTPGAAYLIRPDQYVAARWRRPTAQDVGNALRNAMGLPS